MCLVFEFESAGQEVSLWNFRNDRMTEARAIPSKPFIVLATLILVFS